LYLAAVVAQSLGEICEEAQMMRCANRNLHSVVFHRIETKPLVEVLVDIPVTWNSEKRAVIEKKTIPLLYVVLPRAWARLAHEHTPEEGWLSEQKEETEACWML
jgi:hypothetical protein